MRPLLTGVECRSGKRPMTGHPRFIRQRSLMHEKTDPLIVGRENGHGQHWYDETCAIEWRLVTKVLGRDQEG